MLHNQNEHHWDLSKQVPEDVSEARVLAFYEGEILSESEAHWTWLNSYWLGQFNEEFLFLGTTDDIPWFAIDLKEKPKNLFSFSVREAGQLNESCFAMMSRGMQLIYWKKTHKFCGRCGAPTRMSETEYAVHCDSCNHVSYPRISPCIIVLVTKGDQILLALGNRHKDTGMYSTLAGFMEPGESVEQAVVREVYEEVGVRLKGLEYKGSQTWPFPHQLMLGFEAEWESGEIKIQEDEIADAQWFEINDLPYRAPDFSIAGWLINNYIARRKSDS